jgi:hypothetical protein
MFENPLLTANEVQKVKRRDFWIRLAAILLSFAVTLFSAWQFWRVATSTAPRSSLGRTQPTVEDPIVRNLVRRTYTGAQAANP